MATTQTERILRLAAKLLSKPMIRAGISYLSVCLCLLPALLFSAITVIDDTGQTLVFKTPPERVVSLAPHLTELMVYLGYEQRLVARDSASDYPESIRHLPNMGSVHNLSMEAILQQKPDLILGWYSGIHPEQAKQFSTMGISFFYSEPASLQTILDNMRKLESMFGATETSHSAIQNFEANIQSLKTHPQKKVKVFYQVWNKPLTTLNGKHFVTEIIELCGGENIFAELEILAPQVNIEAVVQRAPDVILSGQPVNEQKNFWEKWQSIPAVKNQAFVYINPDLLVRPGPRLVEGKQALCEAISQFQSP